MGKRRGRGPRVGYMFAESDSGSDSNDSDDDRPASMHRGAGSTAAPAVVLDDTVPVASVGVGAKHQGASASSTSHSEVLQSVVNSSAMLRDDSAAPSVQPIEPRLGRRAAARRRHELRSQTAGDGWFGMRRAELTDERRHDLELLQMRAALDPKAFYRTNDRPVLPKYFQVGTIVHHPTDFYSKPTRKQQKATLLEEIMSDQKILSYQKRLYSDAKREEAIRRRGAFQKSKVRKQSKR